MNQGLTILSGTYNETASHRLFSVVMINDILLYPLLKLIPEVFRNGFVICLHKRRNTAKAMSLAVFALDTIDYNMPLACQSDFRHAGCIFWGFRV